jgi:hypothetical protein
VLQGYDRNRAAPDWVDDEPEIDEIDHWFLDAFWTLSTCRAYGMGCGPIPWMAIDHFATRRGLTDANARMLSAVIREMDSAFLTWQSEEAEARRKK